MVLASLVLGSPPSPASSAGGDLARIFEQANVLKDTGACDEAILLYEQVARGTSAEQPSRAQAIYNQGICLELLNRPGGARQAYDRLLGGDPVPPELARDARFRRGLSAIEDGDDRRARQDFHKLLRGAKDPADRAAVALQLGWLDVRAGKRRIALKRIRSSLELFELLLANDGEGDLKGYVAQAQVALGDLWALDARRRPLRVGPKAMILAALSRRSSSLAEAERRYTLAIEQGDARWAQTATLHLGDALDRLSLELLALQGSLRDGAGRGLSVAERGALLEWVGAQIGPTQRKSHEAWTLCVSVAERTRLWTRSAEQCGLRLDEFRLQDLVDTVPGASD